MHERIVLHIYFVAAAVAIGTIERGSLIRLRGILRVVPFRTIRVHEHRADESIRRLHEKALSPQTVPGAGAASAQNILRQDELPGTNDFVSYPRVVAGVFLDRTGGEHHGDEKARQFRLT